MSKILLNTGPSPNGWHKAETFMLCPRRRAWDWYGEQEHGKPWHSDATARGTLLHVGLAHYYRRMQATQQGEDPEQWYTPEVAVSLMPKVETNAFDAITMERHVADVHKALQGYYADYAMEKLRIVAVETVVSFDNIPGMGGVGQPTAKTARIDLIYETGGKLYFLDHKSAGRITREHKWQYSRSGQMLMLRWLGAGLGKRFGGVILNLVQVGAGGKKNQRPPLDSVPGMMVSLPLSLTFWEAMRLQFEASGLPPEMWPTVPSEHSCRGRYASRCPHADKCDVAVPAITQVEWPKFDLDKTVADFSYRTT